MFNRNRETVHLTFQQQTILNSTLNGNSTQYIKTVHLTFHAINNTEQNVLQKQYIVHKNSTQYIKTVHLDFQAIHHTEQYASQNSTLHRTVRLIENIKYLLHCLNLNFRQFHYQPHHQSQQVVERPNPQLLHLPLKRVK